MNDCGFAPEVAQDIRNAAIEKSQEPNTCYLDWVGAGLNEAMCHGYQKGRELAAAFMVCMVALKTVKRESS